MCWWFQETRSYKAGIFQLFRELLAARDFCLSSWSLCLEGGESILHLSTEHPRRDFPKGLLQAARVQHRSKAPTQEITEVQVVFLKNFHPFGLSVANDIQCINYSSTFKWAEPFRLLNVLCSVKNLSLFDAELQREFYQSELFLRDKQKRLSRVPKLPQNSLNQTLREKGTEISDCSWGGIPKGAITASLSSPFHPGLCSFWGSLLGWSNTFSDLMQPQICDIYMYFHKYLQLSAQHNSGSKYRYLLLLIWLLIGYSQDNWKSYDAF